MQLVCVLHRLLDAISNCISEETVKRCGEEVVPVLQVEAYIQRFLFSCQSSFKIVDQPETCKFNLFNKHPYVQLNTILN